MKVVLPWPPKELSPNARVHWLRKAEHVRNYQALAFYAAKAASTGEVPAYPHIIITFHAPDNRPRDLDNMLSSLKSALDGISKAIHVDDSKWSITITKGEPVKGGQVVVEVTG